ncbi:MAG TPA: hypothetical protein VLB73_03000 [Patescibacteria group bacterium]|nr:hypothetical protein [Patescibacteria group bacterium]
MNIKKIFSFKKNLSNLLPEKMILTILKKQRYRIYIILLLGVFALILYRLTFLPYFNILFNPTIIFYSIIFSSLLVLQLSPNKIIQLVIVIFVLAIVPTLLNLQGILEIMGNIAFVSLLAAVILYIVKMRKEV